MEWLVPSQLYSISVLRNCECLLRGKLAVGRIGFGLLYSAFKIVMATINLTSAQ